MVLNGGITAKDADQSQVYDLEGNSVGEPWLKYGRPSHYDLTLDEHGDDIAVGVSKSPPDSGRVIKRRLRDGMVTVLTSGGYATHISTRNVASSWMGLCLFSESWSRLAPLLGRSCGRQTRWQHDCRAHRSPAHSTFRLFDRSSSRTITGWKTCFVGK